MDRDIERTSVVTAALHALGAWLGPALLVGLALPLQHGWGLPLLLIVGAVVLHTMRGEPTLPLDQGSVRFVVAALVVLPAGVVVTVAARAVASVVIAYPAALWAVPLVLAGVLTTRLGRGRVPPIILLAALVPVAGVYGTRYEARAQDARGFMESGPIHGIHPGQTTAVIIDGYGPFDLPVNDYVEPSGERGYSPEAFGEMLEESLHRIADVHFANGPARARLAFAEAKVEVVTTPPVRERLSKEPVGAQEHHRFIVRSGTFGQRSRVEFVCPGRRDDPRGHQGENIMNRMCPSKYASEASAGLGVTGRWPGYVEFRGNERLGLSTLMGWTRSDDTRGGDVLVSEQRRVAWVVIAVLLVIVAWRRRGEGVATVGGAVGLGALAFVLALTLGAEGQPVQVGLVESARAAPGGYPLLGWVAALLLVGGLPPVGEASAAQRRGYAWGRRIAAAGLAVSVLLLAANLSGQSWIVPSLYGEADGELALQAWVAGAAEGVGERFGLSILEMEGAIAAAVVAALLGGIAHALGSAAGTLGRLPGRRTALWGLLAVGAVAVAVTVSRKTLGAGTLLPGAIGLTAILYTGLHIRQRGMRPLLVVLHFAAVAIGLVLIGNALAVSGPHPFVSLCVLIGALTALAGGALPFLQRSL